MLPLVLCLLTVPAQSVEDAPFCPPEEPAGCSWDFRGDYLHWYLRKMDTPPLMVTAPPGESGDLDDPDSTVIRGGRLTSRHQRYIGMRWNLDVWAADRSVAIQLNAFFLERDSSHFTARQGSVHTLAIPYVDAVTGANESRVIHGVDPVLGRLWGGMRVYSRTELFGQEGNALIPWCEGDAGYLYLVAGGRFLQLRERLDLTSTSRVEPDRTTVYGLEDHLSLFNRFYGAQVGLQGELRHGGWFVDAKGTVALGVDTQQLRSKGFSVYHAPGVRTTAGHGLFVLPSNTGEYERAVFDVVTEVRLDVGYEWKCWRLYLGYSFLTWANPARPGDQIGPVNLSQVRPSGLVGPALPDVPWETDFFWAHGANIGLELRW